MLKIYNSNHLLNLSIKPIQKIIFFSNYSFVNQSDTFPVFNNADTIIFNYCDKLLIYHYLNPKFFPNLKTVYMNSWCGDEIYRFDKIIVYAPLKIYDNNIVCGQWKKSSAFIKIIDAEHFRVMEKMTIRE